MAWLDELQAALRARDAVEKADQALIEKYCKLADQSALNQTARALDAGPDDQGTPRRAVDAQQEFIDAQRERSALQKQVAALDEDMTGLRDQKATVEKRAADLQAERNLLAVKLRDREEELRGKAKLLEDLHDETVALTLQLNVMEEKNTTLGRDNQELVDRWMARVKKDADDMHLASKYS